MGMDTDMDEIRMILAVRALRKLLHKGDHELVAVYRRWARQSSKTSQ
jgi:hypothetical protein